MLPPHHLPQLIPNRVFGAIERLKAMTWSDVQSVDVEATDAQPTQLTLSEGMALPLKKCEPCTFWGKLFDQRWCRVRFPNATDENTWLRWLDQGEATLYVEGRPWFGFNVAHRECRLPAGVKEVWLQSSCIQSAIWHPEANGMKASGSLFEGAFIMRRDDQAWNAYHDLKCLFDLAMDQRNRENDQLPTTINAAQLQHPVDQISPVYRMLLHLMNKCVDALETNGLSAMISCLADAYNRVRMDKTFSTCILTGHAHLDLVWIWPERMGELKAVNLFATANRLMEDYPEFRFAYSQPASYEAVKRREPSLYDQMLKRISTGQWQATGAMYVESDTIFACGEALARSFTLGQEEFSNICGATSRLTWLPDVFGYSACLPQIMQQTGVDYFFTTKMTWNAINRFPHSSFIWKGNDGSEVLAHVTQESGYVTHMSVDNIKAPMHGNQQAHVHDEYLLPTGYGDGGGGPTTEMLERARRLDALPGMPEIRWDQPEAFFERLKTVRDELPVYQGECYLEFHRGVYTTHSNLKASFRRLERCLQTAEAAAALTAKCWKMKHAWKRLVFAQFHDYIPGSSVWDVYKEGVPELEELADLQLKHASKALSEDGEICLFNPHASVVRRWVEVEGQDEPSYVELAPLSGSRLVDIIQDKPKEVTLEGLRADNGLISFQLNEDGWIDSLTVRDEQVALAGQLGQFMLYPDKAAFFEAWDIDRHTLSNGQVCQAPAVIQPVKEHHRSGYSISRSIGDHSQVTVQFLLEMGSPLLHVEIDLDWNETESLLKLIIPTSYASVNARYGIPFGSVLRPQVTNGNISEAMWEVPFNRYMAVFDETERDGIFVISECKYGASVRDGKIGVSLVRSPRVTGMDSLHAHAWPPHLTRLEGLSSCSDLGRHHIRLALGRYDVNAPREHQPASLADTLFTDAVVYKGKPLASIIESITGGDTLIPCWVCPGENGSFTLRFHEVAGRRGKVSLQCAPDWQLATTDISESQSESLTDGEINFSPYQVLSIKFRPLFKRVSA